MMLRDGTASDGSGIRRLAVGVGAAGQLLPSLETIQREIDTIVEAALAAAASGQE